MARDGGGGGGAFLLAPLLPETSPMPLKADMSLCLPMSLPNGDCGLGGDTPRAREINGNCLASCGALPTLVNDRKVTLGNVLVVWAGCSYAAPI